MNTVWVSQETLKRSQSTGEMYQFPSLRPAEEFGNVKILLDFNEAMDLGDDDLLWTLRKRLAGYGAGDYILPLGSPTIMALTVALAAEINNGEVNILNWDRDNSRYLVRRFDLNAQPRNG